jgi:hypothetical protein
VPNPIRFNLSNAAGPDPATIATDTPMPVDSPVGDRWDIGFFLDSPPQSTFYIRGDYTQGIPDQPVEWSPDWTTLRDNLQAALDRMFGPGNSGIVGPNQNIDDELWYGIYFSPALGGLPPLTNILNGNANFEADRGRVSDELQQISFGGNITGGSFTLSLLGKESQTVAWDSDRAILLAHLRAALDALAGPDGAAVLNGPGDAVDIKFGGPRLTFKDMPQLVADGSSLIGNSASVSVTTILDGTGLGSTLSPQPGGEDWIGTDGMWLRSTVFKQGNGIWLAYNSNTGTDHVSTPPIDYSDHPSVMQANIQGALDALVGPGKTAVAAASSTEYDIMGLGLDADSPASLNENLSGSYPVITSDLVGSTLVYHLHFAQGSPPDGKFALTLDFPGRASIRWMRVDAQTNIVEQAGNLTDPSLSFYYPSIAANAAGDVVIGFSGSSSQQYPSAFYALGHTVDGHTTFDQPRLIAAGTGNFFGNDPAGGRRWGDYSATVLDPSDPTMFWTFQEYTVADDTWGVKIAAIRTASPDPDEFLQMHNLHRAMDVSGDGTVAPEDAVAILSYLNAHGAYPVPSDALGAPYCDVDGDGMISPSDSVDVLSFLNAHGAEKGEGPASGESGVGGGAAPSNADAVMMLLAMDAAAQPQKKR